MKSAKKSSILFVALCSAMLFSCGENHPSSSSNTGNNPSSSMITPTTEVSSTTSLPKDYYGEVEFEGVYIYDNDFDGIQIRPFFTKPEEAKDEVFEYTVKNEDVCFIEDDRIYYQGPGTTIVQAKSEHLKASFAVTAAVANDKNFPYKNSANYKISRAQSMKAEDTLFIGDSFFEFWANKINIDESFNEAFSNYSTLNIGISATTTHDWRVISNKLFENTDVEPKNVVINIGINNVDDDHESGTACARNIQSLIQDYLDAYENTNIYYFSLNQ